MWVFENLKSLKFKLGSFSHGTVVLNESTDAME